jgi:transposase
LKTKEAEQAGLQAMRKRQMRKHGNKDLSRAQTAYNLYVILVTSITNVTADLILDLYRQRRHIEMAYKRLKPLFKYHEIPVHVEQSALAWFYGK